MAISRWIPVAAVLLSLLPPSAPAAVATRKAPDFVINMPGGKTLPLSQYKDHPMVMAFILTYCPHCQLTVGILTKMQNEYGPRGLQVVASAIETGADKNLSNFLKNYAPSFPVGYNVGDSALSFMQHPAGKIPMMPMLAFIDKQGNIRAQYEGDDPFFNEQIEANIRKEIDSLMKPLATAKKSTAPVKKTGAQ
jgi:thiol-disulfide isomerase/thioredoxin